MPLYHDMVTVISLFQHDLTPLVEIMNDKKPLKELRRGLRILKKSLAQIFQVCRLQFVLIFSFRMHLCCFLVDY